MRRFVLACALVWTTTTVAPALDLVKNGKAAATIVTAEKCPPSVGQAAKMLAQHVEQATGVALPVVTESKASGEVQIHIGWTEAVKKTGLLPDRLTADGYYMQVKGKMLVLAGRDDAEARAESYSGAKGTHVAAMHLLRDYAGVRWLMPGVQGVWTPKRDGLSVPDDLDRAYAPTFWYATTRLDRYNPWSAANGARQPLKLFTAGGHTWVHGVPPAKFAKDHPEYFALVKGKRLANPEDKNPMLCTSNLDFVTLMTAWMESKFDEGFDIVQLGQSDGITACECDQCNQQFGPMTPAGKGEAKPADRARWRGLGRRVFVPHLEICRRLLKSRPGKVVMLLIYSGPGQYVNLLQRGEEKDADIPLPFPSNVLAEVTDCDPDVLARMKTVAPNITTYNYYWSTYHGGLAPKQSPETISRYLGGMVKVGSIGTYFCGGAENWPAEAPTYYVGLRTIQDPSASPDALLAEFCAGLYGPAAETMAAYYRELYARVKVKPDDGVPSVGWLFKDKPRDHTMGEKYRAFWPRECLSKMDDLIKKAEAEAGQDARARGWLRLARVGFDHVRLTSLVYHAAAEYETGKTAEAFRKVKDALAAWNAFVAEVGALKDKDAAFVREFFPNHKTFAEALPKESRSIPMGVPFTWDMKKIEETGKLP
jgi:hypothetical protein